MTDQAHAPAPTISAAEALAKIIFTGESYRTMPGMAEKYAEDLLVKLRFAGFALVPVEPDDAAVERACAAALTFQTQEEKWPLEWPAEALADVRASIRAALRSYTGAE